MSPAGQKPAARLPHTCSESWSLSHEWLRQAGDRQPANISLHGWGNLGELEENTAANICLHGWGNLGELRGNKAADISL